LVFQAHRSLAKFLSVDRFAAPKSPTFHTANVGSKRKKPPHLDKLINIYDIMQNDILKANQNDLETILQLQKEC